MINGIQRKPTYEELVYRLENETLKLNYPDRSASFILIAPKLAVYVMVQT